MNTGTYVVTPRTGEAMDIYKQACALLDRWTSFYDSHADTGGQELKNICNDVDDSAGNLVALLESLIGACLRLDAKRCS